MNEVNIDDDFNVLVDEYPAVQRVATTTTAPTVHHQPETARLPLRAATSLLGVFSAVAASDSRTLGAKLRFSGRPFSEPLGVRQRRRQK